MDDQRLISDARRRARMLSRHDGRPYQTHLDEVARSAGRDDWSAFVVHPCTIPDLPSPTPSGEDAWQTRFRNAMQCCSLLTIVGVIILIALVAFAPSLSAYEHGSTGGGIMGAFAAALLCLSIVLAFVAVATFSARWWYSRDRISQGRLALAWLNAATNAAVALGLVCFGPAYLPILIASPSPDDVVSLQTEIDHTQRIWVEQLHSYLPVVGLSSGPHGVELGLVVVDMRLTARRLRGPTFGGPFPGLAEALKSHPLARMDGRLDCSTNRLQILRASAADSYEAVPAFTVELPPGSKLFFELTPADVKSLCGDASMDA
ncbi:hypothetical protein [Sphingomonas sp. 3-13AW]|uniref:hypothetical protein n=1 Tax=Sphingomonas sp. 3-13AW TaxID=3050450 RepID=UPI003BB686BA